MLGNGSDPPFQIPRNARAEELVRRGDAFFAQGNFQQALIHFAAALNQQPAVAEHAYRVGLALWRLGQLAPAKEHLERALALRPDFAHAHGELARVLLAMGQMAPSLLHARRAVELAPDEPTLLVVLASILQADGQNDAAAGMLDRLIAAGQESTDLAMIFARAAATTGRQKPALAMIERLLGAMQSRSSREQSALHFAAANLLDGVGDYDQAFGHAVAANQLRGAHYDAAATARSFENFIAYFTRDRLARFPRPAVSTIRPVFIVGMPRSGTSLVEQILSSHPLVHGAGELDWIARIFDAAIARGARGTNPTLASLENLSDGEIDALAMQYLDPLRSLAPSAKAITDKMPTNFIYLGLIAMLFPDARIIHCRRDAMDTCVSCFMTDFAGGYEFSFNLSDCGHFQRQYQRMMSHWKRELDLSMLEVDYERVVEDVEGQSRRLLAFLDLPWDERCLRFHESRRFAGTASHAQVRRPVYGSSVGRWKKYEKHLAPLRHALDGE